VINPGRHFLYEQRAGDWDVAAQRAACSFLTVCPFDMSTTKQQAAIKKVDAAPVWRLVTWPDDKAIQLGLNRAKLLVAAMSMERAGLPAREMTPGKDKLCNYCAFKSLCIADGPGFGLMFPPIPDDWKTPSMWEVA
jgi:hypothetical protein